MKRGPCNHQGCNNLCDIIDLSRYKRPVRLCGKHYNELHDTEIGSTAERMFLYRCGIIRDEVLDATVDELVKVI